MEAAGATFPTLIDTENLLADLYGYKAIPNGILLDEECIVRYRKFGGFSVENENDLIAVQRFARNEVEQIEPETSAAPYELGLLERDLVRTRMRLGSELHRRGARDEAVKEWETALKLDPENLTIRKQIWMCRHPERFHPEIDFEWQKRQLERERSEEVAQGICGPEGCPLPYSGKV